MNNIKLDEFPRLPFIDQIVFFNFAIIFSLMHLHWLLLIFLGVVIIETFCLGYFFDDRKLTLRVVFWANLSSTLLATPFLFFGSYVPPLWTVPFSIGQYITEYPYLDLTETLMGAYDWRISSLFVYGILFFFLMWVVSILIEVKVAKILKYPSKRLFIALTLANILSYCFLIGGFVILGFIFTLFEIPLDWLFYIFTDWNNPLISLNFIFLLVSFFLMLILPLVFCFYLLFRFMTDSEEQPLQ